MKFRVIAGRHVQDGRIFGKDEILESEHDLVSQFRNKFERVDDDTPVTPVKTPAPPGPAPRYVANPPETDARFGSPVSPPAPEDAEEGTTPARTRKAPAEKPSKPAGTDVTSDFAKAKEEDFKVFRDKGKLYIYDADDLSKPINPDGSNKGEVDKVIVDHLKTQR